MVHGTTFHGELTQVTVHLIYICYSLVIYLQVFIEILQV